MSLLPNITHYATGKPIFLPYQALVTGVSTINAGTITTDNFFVTPGSNLNGSIIEAYGNTSTVVLAETSILGGSNIFSQRVENPPGTIIQSYSQGFASGDSNFSMVYGSPPATTKGSITILSSINGGTGGVSLTGQDGTSFYLGDGKSFTQSADLSVALATQMGISTAVQNFYVGGQYQCGINFDYPSTIVLTASNVYAPNNLYAENLNVSTINSIPVPPVSYVDPYGPSPIFSTIGSSAVAVPMIPFSTIANHCYQVSLEFSATNGGGGAANDATMIGISNSNVPNGLYGRFISMDTWKVDQTYSSYRAGVTSIFNANSNNGGQSVIELLDLTLGGNVQIVTVEQFVVKDLGLPSNVF